MTGLTVLAYYPIFIKPVDNDILVYIPDFKIYSEASGKTIDQTTDMAKSAIVNTLHETKKFVKPSDIVEAHQKAREDADDICDYSQNSILTFVEVDISDYVDWDLYNNPQEKIGHFIRWYETEQNEFGEEHIPHCKCSECGKEYDPHSSQFIKFCSNCGVRLEAESEVQ